MARCVPEDLFPGRGARHFSDVHRGGMRGVGACLWPDAVPHETAIGRAVPDLRRNARGRAVAAW